ncbi:hypothetical protein RSAG8_12423, partial [Rhizoctonia solani AG-8 WAC10335]
MYGLKPLPDHILQPFAPLTTRSVGVPRIRTLWRREDCVGQLGVDTNRVWMRCRGILRRNAIMFSRWPLLSP